MNFNALKYVEELRNAGMPEKQAEAQIRVLNEVVDSELASKQDVETVREELKRDIKELELRLTHTLTVRLGGNGAWNYFDRHSCESSIIPPLSIIADAFQK